MSQVQKIKEIEAEMARTQKNKATESHLGILKAKVAKLKRDLLSTSSSKQGADADGFDVNKSGDARVGLIGFPSVGTFVFFPCNSAFYLLRCNSYHLLFHCFFVFLKGKSTLLNKLTNTFSEVASYEFTTLTCIPGVIQYKGSKIQLLDLPGIIEGAKDGKGRGRQVISTARTCSLVIIVLDALKPLSHKRIIERELEGFGIRLNCRPAQISFKRKDKGGISISTNVNQSHLTEEVIKDVLKEYRIANADIILRCDATIDQLIDVIEGNRVYMSAVYAINKIDQITVEELDLLDRIPHTCPVSAHHEWNLDGLLEMIWEKLNLVRIYPKPKGQLADFAEPVILNKEHSTIAHFCNRIHKGILPKFKYAYVWGTSVKHNPQKVGKDHQLADEDVVQLIKSV